MVQARQLLVATDIFGSTPQLQLALSSLQQSMPEIELSIRIAQPASCQSEPAVFANDQLAYQAFVRHGGLEHYQRQLASMLEQHQPDLLLGFSAGAAALWCALGHADSSAPQTKALLCYGGQIRQHYLVAPRIPVTCLWSDETHFDVVTQQRQLSQHSNLQQQHWPQQHGFINPYSAGFAAKAATEFWRRCQAWLAGAAF